MESPDRRLLSVAASPGASLFGERAALSRFAFGGKASCSARLICNFRRALRFEPFVVAIAAIFGGSLLPSFYFARSAKVTLSGGKRFGPRERKAPSSQFHSSASSSVWSPVDFLGAFSRHTLRNSSRRERVSSKRKHLVQLFLPKEIKDLRAQFWPRLAVLAVFSFL